MDNNLNNQNFQNYGDQFAPQAYPDPNAFSAGSPMDFNNVYGNGFQPAPVKPAKAATLPMKKKIIILCCAGFGLLVLLSAAIILLSPSKKFLGDWACQKYSTLSSGNNPTTRLILEKDGSFTYGQFNDIINNHYAGTYLPTSLNKKSQNGEVYYQIEFSPTTEFVKDGVAQDTTDRKMDTIEFAVADKNGSKEATMMFVNIGDIYYCTATK